MDVRMVAMNVQHAGLKKWVEEAARMCEPDRVVWLDGSEAEKGRLEREAFATGELIELDQTRLPGCSYHRSAPNDAARTEHLTYICARSKDDAGPTNNWMCPEEGYRRGSAFFKGSMKGRTMYVIPFSMGLVDSRFSKIGVQATDSIYVVLNMRIMTHMGETVINKLGASGEFTRCLHSKADLRIDRRLILHFPEDNTIWSVGSGYGGNALLGKKCLALRIASHLGRKEGWLAEHMLIMGVEDPRGNVTYIAGAFPSACGKTNLAMLTPPEEFKKKGYRVWTVGDDIAWLRIDHEGNLRAMNPETGIFGVAPGTNSKSNPNAVAAAQKNTIFTNVLLKKDRTVWWEEGDGPTPLEGLNWQGKNWFPGMKDEKGQPVAGAHPNSRFTAPIVQCPSLSKEYFDPKGVKISAIIFGGRRAHLAPLVCEARDWQHGVFLGATMASERTAAQVGVLGEVRRDPMAMLPFCGYNMADYFRHWLEMGPRMSRPPHIFQVNWFRKDEKGRLLWPGYGENFRVLLWIIKRCRNEAAAQETPIGRMPLKGDINLVGLDLSDDAWQDLFKINPDEWNQELQSQKAFFDIFGSWFPRELLQEQEALRDRLAVSSEHLRACISSRSV